MSEYYKIIEKLNVFRHVDTAFTERHIVSAASSETGIAGALQHHVLFICRENGGRYKSVEGIT